MGGMLSMTCDPSWGLVLLQIPLELNPKPEKTTRLKPFAAREFGDEHGGGRFRGRGKTVGDPRIGSTNITQGQRGKGGPTFLMEL